MALEQKNASEPGNNKKKGKVLVKRKNHIDLVVKHKRQKERDKKEFKRLQKLELGRLKLVKKLEDKESSPMKKGRLKGRPKKF